MTKLANKQEASNVANLMLELGKMGGGVEKTTIPDRAYDLGTSIGAKLRVKQRKEALSLIAEAESTWGTYGGTLTLRGVLEQRLAEARRVDAFLVTARTEAALYGLNTLLQKR